MKLSTSARDAPDGGLVDTEGPVDQAGRNSDDHADQHLGQQVTLDLLGDLVERLHGDFPARERRPGQFDQFAPEAVARRQQEKRQEHNDGRLSQRFKHARCTGQQVIVDAELGTFDLHPRDAAGRPNRSGATFLGRFLQLGRRLLDLFDRGFRFVAFGPRSLTDLLCRNRQRLHELGGLIGQDDGCSANRGQQGQDHDGRAQRAGQSKAFEPIDKRRQRVTEDESEQQRNNNRLAPLQHEDAGDGCEYRQGNAAPVHRRVQQRRFGCWCRGFVVRWWKLRFGQQRP